MKINFKNWPLLLLAFISAFVIWFVVVQVTDPSVTETFDVAITYENEASLKSSNKAVVEDGPEFIKVTVTKARSIINELSAKDFSATADFSKMYNDTQVPVEVTCSNDSVSSTDMTLESQSVSVVLEKLTTISKVIEYETDGKPASGYVVGEVTVSPTSVDITCPESEASYINKVVIEIDVKGKNEPFNSQGEIKLYDGNGDLIDTAENNITLSIKKGLASYSVSFLQVQTVPITIKVQDTDSVAEGYKYAGVTCEPEKISIKGTREALANVTEIVISDISAKGLNANVTRDIDIRSYIPEDVEIYEDDPTIKVTLAVDEIIEKEITIKASAITFKNLSDSYSAKVNSDVKVKIKGASSVVNKTTAANIKAVINLEDCQAGTLTLSVSCTLDNNDVTVSETPKAEVTLTRK